jgi:hypothetical protein
MCVCSRCGDRGARRRQLDRLRGARHVAGLAVLSRPTVSQTARFAAGNAALVRFCTLHMPAQQHLGSAWEALHGNRAPQRCQQTPQHRALPADASAMTQRESYDAIAWYSLPCERTSCSGTSGHGKALRARRRNPLTRCFSISRVCAREVWRGLRHDPLSVRPENRPSRGVGGRKRRRR